MMQSKTRTTAPLGLELDPKPKLLDVTTMNLSGTVTAGTMNDLTTHGFAVVRMGASATTETVRMAMKRDYAQYMRAKPQGIGASTGCTRFMGHGEASTLVRVNAAILRAFAALHGCHAEDLVSTFPGHFRAAGTTVPAHRRGPTADFTGLGMYHGMFVVGPTNPESGTCGPVVWHASHRFLVRALARTRQSDPKGVVAPGQGAISLMRSNGVTPVRLAKLEAGDLVIWDERTLVNYAPMTGSTVSAKTAIMLGYVPRERLSDSNLAGLSEMASKFQTTTCGGEPEPVGHHPHFTPYDPKKLLYPALRYRYDRLCGGTPAPPPGYMSLGMPFVALTRTKAKKSAAAAKRAHRIVAAAVSAGIAAAATRPVKHRGAVARCWSHTVPDAMAAFPSRRPLRFRFPPAPGTARPFGGVSSSAEVADSR